MVIKPREPAGAGSPERSAFGLRAAAFRAVAFRALALVALAGAAPAAAASFDLIIEHGEVIDGTGAALRRADVGVVNGRIAAVGDLSRDEAKRRIDAAGLYVAPGFINVHDHSTAEALPTAVNMLTQGETTAVLNPDGWGELDIAKQMATLAKGGLALNIAAYAPFNAIWGETVGQRDVRPTPAQITAMRALVQRNLEAGAFGVSAGLDYKPAYFARPEEVVAVVSVASTWRTNFPNHDRLTPETGYSSKLGVAETIAIASAAGLSPEITHAKSQGHEQGGAPELIEMMHKATAAGHYTTGDVYPYTAGMTALFALTVPGWAQEGGVETMLARFKDPAQRPKIITAVEAALNARFGGAKGVYLPASKRQLTDVVKAEGVSPGEALLRVMEKGEFVGIFTFGDEADVRAFLREPTMAIACDCGADIEKQTHPRLYGSYPRVLGRYVRDEHVLTWPDAIRKLTGLPASSLGMVDRGFIAPGMAADIAVIDPKTIIDHATYETPTALSEGVRFVLVNGVVELSDGKPTGAKAGAVILRADNMPTRPMKVLGQNQVRLLGAPLTTSAGETVTLSLDVAQTLSGSAVGHVALTDAKGVKRLVSDALGPLQLGDKWFSVTGWSPAAGGEGFTLIVDGSNPRRPGVTSLVLTTSGGARYTGETPN